MSIWNLDFWLPVGFLAIVPLLMAAYGGHVAAESFPKKERKHRRNVRIKFWTIGVVGVAIAFAFQYRAMKTDSNNQSELKSWQQGITKQLIELLGRPNSPEQKQSAVELWNKLQHPPFIQPVVQAPVYGNLKLRCTFLSNELLGFVNHRREVLTRPPYGQPLTIEKQKEWLKSNEIEYHALNYESKILAIQKELAGFHIVDGQLDGMLNGRQENIKSWDALPQPEKNKMEWMTWTDISDVRIISERLAFLANQVPQ